MQLQAAINNGTGTAFSIPTNYPSEFAKAYLKDTYGQVVYTYQFMSLLSCILIGDDNFLLSGKRVKSTITGELVPVASLPALAREALARLGERASQAFLHIMSVNCSLAE